MRETSCAAPAGIRKPGGLIQQGGIFGSAEQTEALPGHVGSTMGGCCCFGFGALVIGSLPVVTRFVFNLDQAVFAVKRRSDKERLN